MSASNASVQVTGIDHIVLRVKDPVLSVDFYATKLGLEPVRLEEFKQGKAPFPSVRLTPTFILDFMPLNFGLKNSENKLADPAVEQLSPSHPNNVDHFCLTVAGDDIEAVKEQLAAAGVEAEQQFDGVVVRRFGAQGTANSIYLRDPDNNVVELRTYGNKGGQGANATTAAT
jgi:catechol 2,3-dioxygenase-like lactoylglutathione lyase family enzyme